jgi:hypothetical protein
MAISCTPGIFKYHELIMKFFERSEDAILKPGQPLDPQSRLREKALKSSPCTTSEEGPACAIILINLAIYRLNDVS